MQIDESFYVRPATGVKDRTSAGGIVVRIGNDGIVHVALVRGEGVLGAAYILPKGGVEKGETLEAGARREISEEAGFSDLVLLAPLGTRERLSFARTRWITTHYFLFLTRETNPHPTDTNYAYATDWFALDGPLPDLFWPEQRALLETERARIHQLLAEQKQTT